MGDKANHSQGNLYTREDSDRQRMASAVLRESFWFYTKHREAKTPLLGHEKNKATLGDASPCERQETLRSKRPLEFLKGFTHDTAASVKGLRVIHRHILTGAAFPRLTQGRSLDAVNL